jgi:EAL domain-containing protein (putative c-di-GMP-specific phosphodiesterase class I)
MTVRKTLGGASRIFGPTVMALSLISNGPTSEGVETREQVERLRSLGVNFAQGYLMGRPAPIDELERQPQVYRRRLDAA